MTTTDDPQIIGKVLETALDELLGTWRAEWARDPEHTAEPSKCRHCGVSLGDKPEDLVIPMGRLGFLPNVCCESCSQAGKLRLAEEDRLARESRMAGIVPTEFLHWDEKWGNNDARAKALGKFSLTARRNMVLHGVTGSGKTRIAWELVKQLVQDIKPVSWHWLDAFEVSQSGFPKEAKIAEWLIIDDLGNEQKKGWETKWETELLYIMRKRTEWHKPIIITTQLTPQAFKQRFFNGTAAEAVMRRFSERVDSIAT